MKNILNKEEQEFINELSEEMHSQDRRCTQNVGFMVSHIVKVYTDDGEFSERTEDFDDYDLCEDCMELYKCSERLPDECSFCSSDAFHYYNKERTLDTRMGSVFLTAKACDLHIQQNRHHYEEDPKSYGISFWRNPEMIKLARIIFKLGGIKDINGWDNHYNN